VCLLRQVFAPHLVNAQIPIRNIKHRPHDVHIGRGVANI